MQPDLRARWRALPSNPDPPRLPPPPTCTPTGLPDAAAALWLGKLVAGALESVYGRATKSWPLRHPTGRTLTILTKAVASLRDNRVPVGAFLSWQLHVWEAVNKGPRKPPELGWLLAEKRIEAAPAFLADPVRRAGAFMPAMRAYVLAWRHLEAKGFSGRTEHELAELEDLWELAERETVAEQTRVDEMVASGVWMWGAAIRASEEG